MTRAVLFVMLIAGILPAADPPSAPIRVMTFNIRLNLPEDGRNAWPHRRDFAARMILFHEADLIGVQEALHDQVEDLHERLPGFAWLGAGRDDGRAGGEFCPVFYRRDRFGVLDHGVFWLSETPGRAGRGWDAACNRIVTWAKFTDRESGRVFYLFNTHLDHMGQTARRESARLIRERMREMANGLPAVLVGDLNADPGSEPVRILLEPDPAWRLRDAKSISRLPHLGPSYTFTGFDPIPKSSGDPIDYIFVSEGIFVLKHATLPHFEEGRLPSDHYPVFAEILLR